MSKYVTNPLKLHLKQTAMAKKQKSPEGTTPK